MQVTATGMAWYRREGYNKLKSSFVDAQKQHDSYDEWLNAAEEGLKRLTSQGHLVEKVYIDLDNFVEWCRSRNMNVDAKARSQFASEFVARKHRSGN